MKTILASTLLFISSLASAQSISEDAYLKVSYLSYSNGQYSILIQNKQKGCNPDFNITYNFAPTAVSPNSKNNVNENTVTGAQTVFYISAPYSPNATFTVTDRTICQWMGSNPSSLTVKPISTNLPVTIEYFKAIGVGEQVMFEWKTDVEQNASHYNVQRRVDSATWVTIVTVAASGPQVYQASAAAQEAGLIAGAVIMLIVLAAVRMRKALTLAAMVVLMASCSKTSIEKPEAKHSSTMYRLQEVDNDNNTTYSPIVIVNE